MSKKSACLIQTYGEYIDHVEGKTQGPIIVMKDHTRLVFDDGKSKPFDELLSAPDLEDQFAFPYPIGKTDGQPKENADPGRIRVEDFFSAVYGRSTEEVKSHLVPVDWPASGGAKRLLFNRNVGAAEALSRAAGALQTLNAVALRVVRAVGGTFNRRRISGTDRLSAHSFGIAVDLDVRRSAYWRWSKTFPRFINNIPWAVVDIFEKNKFIWGGKWYHFDTMHFEYRPELFCLPSSR